MNPMVLYIAMINFLAAFTQASTGFGYAIVAMFLMPRLLPYRQCSIISAAVIIFIAVQMTFSLRRHIRVRKIVWPMACCLSTTGLGVYLISVLDEATMRKIMGVFLILLALYFYYIKRHKVSIRESPVNGAAVGLLTGMTTGMFNIVGPFLTLYYYDNSDNSLEFKANLEFSFLIAGLFSFILNLAHVEIDSFLLLSIPASGIAAVVAGLIGLRIFRKIDKEKLKYIIICVLPVMGIIQIIK
jgi:uncharacterized membrane protein YfcA